MAIKLCPMCGNENKCSSGKTCWCNDEYFPREIFNQIPPEEVRRSCICKSCLDKYKEDNRIEDLKPSDIGPIVFGRKNAPEQDDEVCYCYEKFKDKLKPGTVTKCFKEKCANYLRSTDNEKTITSNAQPERDSKCTKNTKADDGFELVTSDKGK